MKRYFIGHLLHQLNGISGLAAMENATVTQKQIRQLAEYLRYRFGREEQIVKLQDEMGALDNIVGLFTNRFGQLLSYSANIDVNCLQLYVPHYAVMAFAENCLYHAFEDKEEDWKLSVDLKSEGDETVIAISDNGRGHENFTAWVAESGEADEYEYGSIGSTLRRLHRHYAGAQSAIASVQSSPEHGTTVILRLPHI